MNDTLHTTDAGTPTQTGAPHTPVDGDASSTRSLIIYTIAALGLAFFIRFFIAAPYVVSGASMVPTFYDYHYLIIDRVTYGFEEPQRGDVIVLDLPQDTSRALIKRVIGLPGETVSLEGNDVIISNAAHPNGFKLDESYIDPNNFGGPTDTKITLGPDQFYVLGDNRRVSADSRSWGVLPREDIVGRAVLRLFPFDKIGILPGTVHFDDSSITNVNS
jgi:signal peptidase I